MLTRRELLTSTVLLPLASAAPAPEQPRRIAIITTIYKYLSHGQHIGDRFLVGYPREGTWHMPNVKVVSLFVDQKPEGDLSLERAREFGFKVYPTIAEALCCGESKLACDAVLIIAEHGDYKFNEKGQQLYPRYEFFMQCVDVFKASGHSVPVYTDKALSYSFKKANAMVAASQDLEFPMLAGSSLPVTWRLPDIEMPLGATIEEALVVGNGNSDAMGFHAIEALQCMVERRKGAETGVRSVECIEGNQVWKVQNDGVWSIDLLRSACSRSDTPQGATVTDGRTQDLAAPGALRGITKNPAAFLIEYRDGLRATLLMVDAVQDFNFAARVKGVGVLSTQFFLSPVPNVTYSACLVSKIEQLFMTGRAPYPVQRTLLTSGMLEALFTSKAQGRRLQTPHLAVTYEGPAESQYARG